MAILGTDFFYPTFTLMIDSYSPAYKDINGDCVCTDIFLCHQPCVFEFGRFDTSSLMLCRRLRPSDQHTRLLRWAFHGY